MREIINKFSVERKEYFLRQLSGLAYFDRTNWEKLFEDNKDKIMATLSYMAFTVLVEHDRFVTENRDKFVEYILNMAINSLFNTKMGVNNPIEITMSDVTTDIANKAIELLNKFPELEVNNIDFGKLIAKIKIVFLKEDYVDDVI